MLEDLGRTAEIRKVFSEADSTKWSYKFYTFTEVIPDPIFSHLFNYFP